MKRIITIEYNAYDVRPSSVVEQLMHVIDGDRYLRGVVVGITYVDGHKHKIGREVTLDGRFDWASVCDDC